MALRASLALYVNGRHQNNDLPEFIGRQVQHYNTQMRNVRLNHHLPDQLPLRDL